MIHEVICTYEVCKLAKEKGFPQECDLFYNRNGKLCDERNYDSFDNEIWCYAPSQSLLQRWLREEKGVIVYPFPMYMRWYWGVKIVDTEFWHNVADKPHDDFATYEEAMEVGLKYALENLV